jgi:hypothetical protein
MPTAEIAPPNSLILVMDRAGGEIPDSMAGSLVASTPTCIAVGTLSEHDGTTRVSLDKTSVPQSGCTLVFDGVLYTPSRELVVCSVLDEIILNCAVAAERTRIQVWANDRVEPSEIFILAFTNAT